MIKSFMLSTRKNFRPGKVEAFNFINERLSKQKACCINENKSVAIVLDSDVGKMIY